jgi:hypothetical protein
VTEEIIERVRALPENVQVEVLDFVQYLESKATEREERKAWTDFSLSHAMRGLESEASPYSYEDVKDSYR